MNGWREKIVKVGLACIVFTGFPVIFSMDAVYAQESETGRKQTQYDFIINEALDSAEKSLDPVMEGDEFPEEPILSAPPESEISANAAMVDGRPEETSEKTAEVQDLEPGEILSTAPDDLEENAEDRKDGSTEELEAVSAFVKEKETLLKTEIFKLQYAQAEDIIGDIKKVLTEDTGQLQFDARANSIVATDTPLKIGEIKELIKMLDCINKEVLIKTKVLQIILNDEHQEGVDWEAIVSDYQRTVFSGFSAGADDEDTERLNLGTISREDYGILLDALDTVGVLHTISEENIKAENRQARTVRVLSSVLNDFRRDNSVPDDFSDQENTGASGVPTGTYRDREIQFRLIPTVERDGALSVAIATEIIRKAPASVLPVVKTGDIGQKSVTVQVDNGATVVIGSLFQEVMVESTWKIPLLGDLPLLGFVFRNQGEESRKAEIVTFLTVKTVEKKSCSGRSPGARVPASQIFSGLLVTGAPVTTLKNDD